MRRACQLLIAFGLLGTVANADQIFDTPAFADVIATSPNGEYTVGNSTPGSYSTDLFITGPDGTTELYWHYPLFGGAPAGSPNALINNYGQVVGFTDGGTSDPSVWFAEYYADPFGTFVGATPVFGAVTEYLCCYGPKHEGVYPSISGLSDAGVATVTFLNGELAPAFVETFQLPNSVAVPEPISILLLASVLAAIGLRFVFKRTGQRCTRQDRL